MPLSPVPASEVAGVDAAGGFEKTSHINVLIQDRQRIHGLPGTAIENTAAQRVPFASVPSGNIVDLHIPRVQEVPADDQIAIGIQRHGQPAWSGKAIGRAGKAVTQGMPVRAVPTRDVAGVDAAHF